MHMQQIAIYQYLYYYWLHHGLEPLAHASLAPLCALLGGDALGAAQPRC